MFWRRVGLLPRKADFTAFGYPRGSFVRSGVVVWPKLAYSAVSKLKKFKISKKAEKSYIFLLGWIQCNTFYECEGYESDKKVERLFLHKPVTNTL